MTTCSSGQVTVLTTVLMVKSSIVNPPGTAGRIGLDRCGVALVGEVCSKFA